VPPIPSTTTKRAVRRSAPKALPGGSRAGAIRLPDAARQPASAGWRSTARACMADSPTRSWLWATRSSPRSSPTEAGRNAMAEAWDVRPQAALAALAPVPVRRRAGTARSVLGISGSLSRSSRSHPLVCPVCCSLGRCGGAPVGSTRASHPTRERGAGRAPKHGHPPCRSASARKSKRTHTRASRSRSVEAGWKRGRNAQNPP